MPDDPTLPVPDCDVPHWNILSFAGCETPWWFGAAQLESDMQPGPDLPKAA